MHKYEQIFYAVFPSKSSCPQGHVGSNPTVSARPEQAGACSGFLQPVRLLAGQPLVPQAPDACNDEAPRPLRTKRAVARTLLWRGASGEIFHCQQMSHDLGRPLPCSRGRVSPGRQETQNAPGPGIPVRARRGFTAAAGGSGRRAGRRRAPLPWGSGRTRPRSGTGRRRP